MEVDLSCYVKIMAVHAILALYRSLKKSPASEIRSKLFFALTEKTLNQEPTKLWFCYFGMKAFHLTKNQAI